MKRCELCRKRRVRVLRVRVIGVEECDVCRRCAMDQCNVSARQWIEAEKRMAMKGGKG